MGILGGTGILGINARNLLYLRPFNKKKAVRLADDKLQTKHFLSARGIPVPKLYGVIRNFQELQKFNFSSLPDVFVLKPNLGYGGEGIIPVLDRKLISESKLREQIEDILEGRFSISELADTAFFEQLILCEESLARYAYMGLPDIRIVVHNLIPVMAMLRLPTKESEGKANLHQGAVGVGIDMATGKTTHLLHKNKIISEVPNFGPIHGLKIPYWDEILLLASKIQVITNLGYSAVDIAIDKQNGPMLLEINARAGLSVQIANLAPLRRRLERIQGILVKTPEKGVRVSQDLFGNKIEKEVKKISGKAVVGQEEQVKILSSEENRYVWASVNPLLQETVMDRTLAQELKLVQEPSAQQVKVKLVLGGIRLQTLVRLEDLSKEEFPLVIGKRDLKDFLIDPSKGRSKILKLPSFPASFSVESSFLEMDEALVALDKQVKLLGHLKPLNLKEEREKFFKNFHYNPQFDYRPLTFQEEEMDKQLQKLKGLLDESVVGRLMLEKINELERKLALLQSRGTPSFHEQSIRLYGKPTPELLEAAKEKLARKPAHFPKTQKTYTMDEAIETFKQVFDDYGLGHWKIKVNKAMVSAVSSGKADTLFIRDGASFSEERLRMLVAHEIETHILTAENGKYQPYRLFNRGFADYLETQEGLAIWNQEQVLIVDVEKNYRSALSVFIVDFSAKHSFAETYDYCLKLGLFEKKAFQAVLRVKRGLKDTRQAGAFTKELSYFSGYLQVKTFVENGGDLKDLYYGKYNLRDLPLIKQVPNLKAPRILPKFLR